MNSKEFKEKYYKEIYIGDGVYVSFDGYHIMIRTPRESGDHYIGLEPPVFENLLEYRNKLYEDANKIID